MQARKSNTTLSSRFYRALRPTKPCSGSCRKRRRCKPFTAMWSGWRERATMITTGVHRWPISDCNGLIRCLGYPNRNANKGRCWQMSLGYVGHARLEAEDTEITIYSYTGETGTSGMRRCAGGSKALTGRSQSTSPVSCGASSSAQSRPKRRSCDSLSANGRSSRSSVANRLRQASPQETPSGAPARRRKPLSGPR